MNSKGRKPLGQMFNESYNWIVIIAASIVTIGLNLVTFVDGKIKVNTFEGYTPLMWTFWVILTFLPPILAVAISVSFQKEGIRQGEVEIGDIIEEYRKLISVNNIAKLPRSKDEYIRERARKQTAFRLLMTLIVSLISGQLLFSTSGDSLIKTVIQLSTVLYFGIRSYGDAYNYATNELKEWYILEINKFKERREVEELFNGKYLDVGGLVYEDMKYKIELVEVSEYENR